MLPTTFYGNQKQPLMFWLVGGFNPIEKHEWNWIISTGRGENKQIIWNHNLVSYV